MLSTVSEETANTFRSRTFTILGIRFLKGKSEDHASVSAFKKPSRIFFYILCMGYWKPCRGYEINLTVAKTLIHHAYVQLD